MVMESQEDQYCCEAQRPAGFTYYASVTVCNTCLTQFPYYDCYCELVHEPCDYERRHKNCEARTAQS